MRVSTLFNSTLMMFPSSAKADDDGGAHDADPCSSLLTLLALLTASVSRQRKQRTLHDVQSALLFARTNTITSASDADRQDNRDSGLNEQFIKDLPHHARTSENRRKGEKGGKTEGGGWDGTSEVYAAEVLDVTNYSTLHEPTPCYESRARCALELLAIRGTRSLW